jgi:Reverse transcriptase (RNA-dependent DNA polymerase)
MEADFNFLNKLIGKRVMAHAEACGTIAQEQYGSRKQKSALLHATNKQLSFDILRQCKKNVALVVLDAKSCYDRISPPIASLALARQGTPQSFIEMMFTTIDRMKHHIRTKFGDSEVFYERDEAKFHGILQGNGAGPTIWTMVSTPILNNLRDAGFGAKIICPITSHTTTIPAFAFVDDTDLIQTIDPTDTRFMAHQHALDLWEEGLRTTGGALVPEKCLWFAIRHHWVKDKWQFHTTKESLGTLTLRNDDGTREELHQQEPHKAVKSLGVMFAPSGSMVDETNYLTERGQLWANQCQK